MGQKKGGFWPPVFFVDLSRKLVASVRFTSASQRNRASF